jgi:signal transduction histidine kinase
VVREKHGGDLTFDTVIGSGTTFHIRLPISDRAPAVASTA